MSKSYTWTGALGTDFDAAGNWDDDTDRLNPSLTAPGSLDTVLFYNTGGTISGNGTVDTLMFGFNFGSTADWTITGTLDAIGGGIENGNTLILGATALLEGSTFEQYQTGSDYDLDMLVGSRMILTGPANPISLSTVFSLGGQGTIDGATLDAAAGMVSDNGVLIAEDGAIVTAQSTSVQGSAGISVTPATLTISGPDTTWHDIGSYDVVNGFTYDTGSMLIGADGSLLVSDGATLTEDGSATVESGGSATITGGATWTIGTGLTIGRTGNGSVSALSGGTIHTTGNSDFIGNDTTGNNSVTVDGVGSDYSSTGSIIVGNLGAGTLTVSNSAHVSAGAQITVGGALGGTGTLTVESGGTVDSAGIGLTVGSFASGSVSVLTGGTIQSTGIYDLIGNGASGEGSVTVDGEGSDYSSTGSIDVGNNAGSGTLTVSDSASVSAGVQIVVGGGEGSKGTLTVESGGSVDSTGTGYGAITVGAQSGSDGIVYVEAGSTLESIAALNPDNYFLLVGENGSTTNIDGDFVPAANGAIYVQGIGARLTTDGNTAQIGASGNGTLSVTGGATAAFGVSSDAASANAALSVAYSGNGTVIVSGAGSSLTASGFTLNAAVGWLPRGAESAENCRYGDKNSEHFGSPCG